MKNSIMRVLCSVAVICTLMYASWAEAAGCGGRRSTQTSIRLLEFDNLRDGLSDEIAAEISAAYGANARQCRDERIGDISSSTRRERLGDLAGVMPFDLGPEPGATCSRCLPLPAVSFANLQVDLEHRVRGQLATDNSVTGAQLVASLQPQDPPQCFVPAVHDSIAKAAILAVARERADEAKDRFREAHQSEECIRQFEANVLAPGTTTINSLLNARAGMIGAFNVIDQLPFGQLVDVAPCVAAWSAQTSELMEEATQAHDAANDMLFHLGSLTIVGTFHDANAGGDAIGEALSDATELRALIVLLEDGRDRLVPRIATMSASLLAIDELPTACPLDRLNTLRLRDALQDFYSAVAWIHHHLTNLRDNAVDFSPSGSRADRLPGAVSNSQAQFRQLLRTAASDLLNEAETTYNTEIAIIQNLRIF